METTECMDFCKQQFRVEDMTIKRYIVGSVCCLQKDMHEGVAKTNRSCIL